MILIIFLTSTTDDKGCKQENYLFWFVLLSVAFKIREGCLRLTFLSRGVSRVELWLLASEGVDVSKAGPVTQHHHLPVCISRVAEGHCCSQH